MIEGDMFQERTSEKSNLRSVVSGYIKYWPVFVVFVLIGVSLAWLRIRYTVREYVVSSTILIKDNKDGSAIPPGVGMADIDLFRSAKNIEDQIIMLKSKSLMERVLRELSFNTTFYQKGRVHDLELYHNLPVKLVVHKLEPGAYGRKFYISPGQNNSFILEEEAEDGTLKGTTYKFGQQINKRHAEFTVLEGGGGTMLGNEKMIFVFHDVAKLAGYYSGKLSITPVNKQSNAITVSLTDPVWEKSVDILNKLIEVYEQEAVEDKNLTAANSLSFIDERLRYLTAELNDVEKNVELYKKKNDLTDVSSEAELYLRSADEYNKQLAEFDIQIDLLKSIGAYLEKEDNKYELVPSSLNIQDVTLLNLMSKFNELQLERQRMLHTTRPDNPLIVNLNEQLNNLRLNIVENIKNIQNGLIITRGNLVSSSSKFEFRKKKVPVMERELLEINRQQGVKEGLYLYLLQKREESALSLAATVSNFRVIDPPSVSYPIGPNVPLLYFIAVLLGLGFPFGILYIRNLLNDKIQDVKDIEMATRVPVLGEIARNKTKDPIVVLQERSNPLVEMFRLVRSNLQFTTAGKPNKVILVTSSISGEGKTFFSINLAASLVLTGKKVVVLGMDLRKPTLTRTVDISESEGITSYLSSDTLTIDEIIRPSGVLDDLYIIPAGPVTPNPTELLMTSKVETLFETLKLSFDHIVIDSAPIGMVADSYSVAAYIDSTVYMMRCNYTLKEQIGIVDRIFREKKLKNPSIVLNDARLTKGYGYGYGYGYGKTMKSEKPAKVEVSNTVDSSKLD